MSYKCKKVEQEYKRDTSPEALRTGIVLSSFIFYLIFCLFFLSSFPLSSLFLLFFFSLLFSFFLNFIPSLLSFFLFSLLFLFLESAQISRTQKRFPFRITLHGGILSRSRRLSLCLLSLIS